MVSSVNQREVCRMDFAKSEFPRFRALSWSKVPAASLKARKLLSTIMLRPHHFLSAALVTLLPICTHAFYLPGAAPRDYKRGEQVSLLVNALTPMLSGHEDSKLVGGQHYGFKLQ